jgi:hypothetical protein
MKVTFLGTNSIQGNCETLYATDRGTLLVQGKIVTDPEALATIQNTYAGLGADETVVEIPADLVRFAPKAV